MDDCCRILIVDDEYIMRQGIRHMINWEEQGYQVIGEASNGKEALDLMEMVEPHIVLCDIAMPVMDGLDFMRVVHKTYPDVQIIVLSGYDKFEYVRQALLNGAVDYVLKPTLNPQELLKMLGSVAARIPNLQLKQKTFSSLEEMLERYLNGVDQEPKKLEFSRHFSYTCYRLLGLTIRLRSLEGKDMSHIIFEKVESYLKQNRYGSFLKFLKNQEFLCIVFNYSLKDEMRLQEAAEELMQQLSVIHERAFAVLGKSRRNLAEIKEDFKNPVFWEEEAFYQKGRHLYLMDKGDTSEDTFKKFDFKRFSATIADGKYILAAEMFRDYIDKAMEQKMPEVKLKNQTKNLLYNLIGSVDVYQPKLEEIRYEYFKEIDEALYVEDFRRIFESLMEKLLDCLKGELSQDDRLKNMLVYIEENYQDELDLTNLAREFNFNYTYLSAYFNAQMGEGFSEYLNRIRISHACALLENQQMSIAGVSSKVGYSDQSYFCRVFKKITGVTPSSYRRGHMQRKR